MMLLYPFYLLLPLGFLAAYFIRRPRIAAVLHPQIPLLQSLRPTWKARLRKPTLIVLAAFSLILFSLAAARPQFESYLTPPEMSRNLILTLDLSGSMGARDFQTNYGRTNRLEAVKSVVAEFIKARPKDRIGIVVFGTHSFLQSPLTLDHELLVEMVKRLQVGMAGEDTAIGDGLGLSLKRIQDVEGQSKAIILLTDGVNHAGEVNPLKAAQIAKDLGIKVHTVGIGSNQPMDRGGAGFLFQRGQPEFDEATLKKIAEITGGVYYNANTLEGLKEVYDEIDKLETTKADDPSRRISEELFPFFAGAAIIVYLCLVILSRSLFLKVPN